MGQGLLGGWGYTELCTHGWHPRRILCLLEAEQHQSEDLVGVLVWVASWLYPFPGCVASLQRSRFPSQIYSGWKPRPWQGIVVGSSEVQIVVALPAGGVCLCRVPAGQHGKELSGAAAAPAPASRPAGGGGGVGRLGRRAQPHELRRGGGWVGGAVCGEAGVRAEHRVRRTQDWGAGPGPAQAQADRSCMGEGRQGRGLWLGPAPPASKPCRWTALHNIFLKAMLPSAPPSQTPAHPFGQHMSVPGKRHRLFPCMLWEPGGGAGACVCSQPDGCLSEYQRCVRALVSRAWVQMAHLRGSVERVVHDLLVGPHAETKLAILPHLHRLAAFCGRRDTADLLLPPLLTFLNSPQWQASGGGAGRGSAGRGRGCMCRRARLRLKPRLFS